MFTDKVETLANKAVNFQKLSWYKNSHRVLNVQLGTAILHNRTVCKQRLLLNVVCTFLYFELPGRLVNSLAFLLLLFILLHCKNVVQKPLKNYGITVNADINLIVVTYLFEAPIEVLHVFNQETPAESEVPLLFFAVIYNVNHYAIFEVCSFKKLKARLTR